MSDRALSPIDLGNNWGIRISSGVKKDDHMMAIVLPKSKTSQENFRQDLLKRIQIEIDSNTEIVNALKQK